jgi:hypothetical protein
MYKIFIALIIGCLSKDIFAACPTSLSGKYSGQATYTEVGNGTVDEVAEKLMVISFGSYSSITKTGTVTASLYVEVDSGTPGTTIDTTSKSYTYTYNTTSCSFKVSSPSTGDMYFVVANSGNTLYGVKRDLTYNAVERYIFTKQ